VVDDAVYEAEQKAKEQVEKENEKTWEKIAKLTLKSLSPFSIFPADAMIEIVKLSIEEIGKLRSQGVDVLSVSKTQANSLIFPPGHPRDNIIYVGHPLISKNYYPFADFHRCIFEHKFSEVNNLLMSLGVEELEVVRIEGYSSEFAVALGLDTPIEPVSASYKQSSQIKTSKQAMFKASFDPKTEPKIPPGLYWYHFEPTWQSIAKGRTDFGLKDFTLFLRYEDDFGINKDLNMKISKVGLVAGGSFKEYQSTIWKISGKFH